MNRRGWVIPILLGAVALSTTCIAGDETGGGPKLDHGAKRISVGGQHLEQLKKTLEQRGWEVRKEKNGDLLIFPETPSVTDNIPIFVDKKGESGKAVSSERPAVSTSDKHALDELEKQARKKGWKVQRNTAGDLLLFPGDRSSKHADSRGKRKTIPLQDSDSRDITIESNDLDRLEKTIREKGWRVKRDKSGDLLLYPPEPVLMNKPDTVPAATINSCFSNNNTDATLTGRFTVPLASIGDAQRVAKAWVASGRSGEHSAVGKIRRVNGIYIVSIVSDQPPFQLRQQLVIAAGTGATVSFP